MASNTARSPKDLKKIVSASQQDVEIMHSNLEKLKNLSRDDKTEAGMLRSRIDEQSHLICILKQRADDAVMRTQTLEGVNKELEKFRENAQDLLSQEIQKCNLLDKRFYELADNHEEIIRFKDEYKKQNEELRQENAELKKENSRLFCGALEERDQKIASMGKHIGSLKEQCKEYQNHCSKLKNDLHEREKALQTEISDLKSKLKTSEQNLKAISSEYNKYKDSIQRTERDQNVQLVKMTKERQEFLDLAMQRGKLIQDKQKEVKKLQEKVREAEREVEQMEAKFEQEAAEVSANLKVIKLKEERDNAEGTLKELRMEYEAFKKHTNSLLTKEKSLNAKLRNLVT